MISYIFLITFFAIFLCKYFADLKTLPPGPLLPIPILRWLPWTEFYGKNDMEIILSLEKKYKGVFNVHLRYRRVVMMSDFEKVQVKKVLAVIFKVINVKNVSL